MYFTPYIGTNPLRISQNPIQSRCGLPPAPQKPISSPAPKHDPLMFLPQWLMFQIDYRYAKNLHERYLVLEHNAPPLSQ